MSATEQCVAELWADNGNLLSPQLLCVHGTVHGSMQRTSTGPGCEPAVAITVAKNSPALSITDVRRFTTLPALTSWLAVNSSTGQLVPKANLTLILTPTVALILTLAQTLANYLGNELTASQPTL